MKKPITKDIYNDFVFQEIGLKHDDVCDIELMNKYLEKVSVTIE